ncbi:MAG: hypothetical protein ACJASC_001953 [Limimaricola cinnabarinus]|jgi:hypothetical protein
MQLEGAAFDGAVEARSGNRAEAKSDRRLSISDSRDSQKVKML